jgi:hypothetical protein
MTKLCFASTLFDLPRSEAWLKRRRSGPKGCLPHQPDRSPGRNATLDPPTSPRALCSRSIPCVTWSLAQTVANVSFRESRRVANVAKPTSMTQCMVRPCVARGFIERLVVVLHQCIRPLIGARHAPGHHGYQCACDLISGQASTTGPFGSPVFACAGKTEPPLVSSSRRCWRGVLEWPGLRCLARAPM